MLKNVITGIMLILHLKRYNLEISLDTCKATTLANINLMNNYRFYKLTGN